VDPFAVEVGNGDVATVVLAIGDSLGRRDFVEAAPAISTDPRIRLSSASPHRCDGKETKVFHRRSGQQRLVAHHQQLGILGRLTPG
jgi:hypothetical protein